MSCLAALPCLAQGIGLETADMEGRVLRGTMPAPGARVLLIHRETGRRWDVQAAADGRYALRFIPAGRYRLSADLGGAATSGIDLVLAVGTRHRLDIPLVETVTVDVREGGPEQARSQVSAVVTPEELSLLPVLRRNYQDLALVTPLAVSGRGPVTGGAPDSRLSFLGASPRQNLFLLDGLDNSDLGNGNLRMPLPQEAIHAFQVLAGGYGAELGRASGGVVNAVSRGGGQAFSGTAFWFERPGSLDAQPALGPTTRDLRLHQFGMSAGGPLVKDRAFWFLAAERLEQRDRGIVTIAPEIAGLARAQGFPVDRGSLPADERISSVFAKVDLHPDAAQTLGLTLAWSEEHNENQIPWGGLVARSAGGGRDTRSLSLGLTHRWILSEALVHEARLQYAVRDNALTSLEHPDLPAVVLHGAATFGSQMLAPQSTTATLLQATETLTGIRGDHTWKAGLELLDTLNRGRLEDTFAGYYLFAALPPLGIPTSVAAFAAPNPFGGHGLPVAFLQKFGDPSTRFRARSLSAFLQDEWRPVPALSLRAGLRWERQAVPDFQDTADLRALAAGDSARLPDDHRPFGQLLMPARVWSSSRISPRFAFRWEGWERLRCFGGAGVFTGPINLGPVFGIRIQNGPGAASVLRTLLDPPMVGPWISWASADGLAVDRRYSAPPPGTRMLVIPGTMALPELRQAHLGFTWLPRTGWELEAEGTRAWGRHLMNLRDVNAAVAAGGTTRRPDPRYGSVFRADASGESRAWTLAFTLRWRPDPSLSLEAAYVRSLAEDNYVDWTGAVAPQDTFDPGHEWGPSYQSQRHRLLLNLQWRRGPWSAALLGRVGAGRPATGLAGYDRNLDGDAGSDRPEGWGRNSLETPWTRSLDLRVTRTLLEGTLRLDAVLDVFNALNRSNVLEIQNSLASQSPAFGSPTVFAPMRQVQLGLRAGW